MNESHLGSQFTHINFLPQSKSIANLINRRLSAKNVPFPKLLLMDYRTEFMDYSKKKRGSIFMLELRYSNGNLDI